MARQLSWRGLMSFDAAGDGRPAKVAWQPVSPVAPPTSVVEATRLMQFGGVLSLLEIPRALLTREDLRRAYAAEARNQQATVSGADLDRVVTFSLTLSVVFAGVSAALWFAMSRWTLRGSRWARWGATGVFGLGLVFFFGGLLPTAGIFARVFALAVLVIGAWALVRLWHRDTSAWIRYRTQPQE